MALKLTTFRSLVIWMKGRAGNSGEAKVDNSCRSISYSSLLAKARVSLIFFYAANARLEHHEMMTREEGERTLSVFLRRHGPHTRMARGHTTETPSMPGPV
jgi:hypothetical protein